MRKDFGAGAKIFPEPVFIIGSYDENGKPDAMNAAWGGMSGNTQISVCVSKNHITTDNIKKTGAFTVSSATADYVSECDYLGIVSAADEPDKLGKAGFHTHKSDKVNAPVIDELPICLECRLLSYDDRTEELIGEIVNVSVDESVLTDGKVDVSKVKPITFDSFNHEYHVIGEKVGNAFSDGKKIK